MIFRWSNKFYFKIFIIYLLLALNFLYADEWTIYDSFENNNFDGVPGLIVWSQGGDVNWTIDSDAIDGTYSAKSGSINDNQTSTISTTAEIPYLPGSISFSFKTSTETNYDKLKFYVDGTVREEWDGINPWTDVTFVLNPSSSIYTFTWEYYKDGSVSSNDDAVWIDNIRITGHEIEVDAGPDIEITFEHDGIPGGEVQMDGTNTYPDENANLSIPGLVAWFQSEMEWYLSEDQGNVLATGPNPIITLDCSMNDSFIDTCIGDHTVILNIAWKTLISYPNS